MYLNVPTNNLSLFIMIVEIYKNWPIDQFVVQPGEKFLFTSFT